MDNFDICLVDEHKKWYNFIVISLLLKPKNESRKMSKTNIKKTENNDLDLMPLSEAARLSGYTPEHLNLLSRKGVLRSQKIGRNWHITKSALNEYLKSINREPVETPEEIVGSLCEYKAEKAEKKSVGIYETAEEENNSEKMAAETDAKEYFGGSIPEKSAAANLRVGVMSMVIMIPLVFFISSVARYTMEKVRQAKIEAAADNLPENQILNDMGAVGEVKGETNSVGIDTAFASENYKISQISLGGQGISLDTENTTALAVNDVKSESFISGKKETAKLVVSWNTSVPAESTLSYSKNNGQNSKNISEESYGYVHSAVVADLDPRTSYVYSVKAKDRWGNEVDSNFFGVYTASKPASVFDLIAGALGDVFGWAMKKP